MPGGFGSARDQSSCPCGGRSYGLCCGPLHWGERRADTAEQLMRSRYSAFARGEVDYLIATHLQPGLSESERRLALGHACRQTRWLGLTIISVSGGGPSDLEGTVWFEARYRGGVLKETSLFARKGECLKGPWLYVRSLE